MTTSNGQELSREEYCHEIEHRHGARCIWQTVSDNRTMIVEGLWFPKVGKTGRLMIAVKCYGKPIPKDGSSKSWPRLESYDLHESIAPESVAWDDLETALVDREAA